MKHTHTHTHTQQNKTINKSSKQNKTKQKREIQWNKDENDKISERKQFYPHANPNPEFALAFMQED